MDLKGIKSKIFTLFSVFLLITSGLTIILISIPPLAEATSTWTQTSDADFKNGTMNHIEINGSGEDAELRLQNLPPRWIEQNLSTKPSARADHAMASIWGTNKVILFSGFYGITATPRKDAWLYNLSKKNWIKITGTIPTWRMEHAMATIWGTDMVLLYGGRTFDGGPWTYLTDTWIYNLSADKWLKKSPISNPGKREELAMAPIYGTDKVILVGGGYSSGGWHCYNDTWIYNVSNNTWIKMDPLGDKLGELHRHAMASIYGTDKVVFFGGYMNGKTVDDTWVYDLSDNNWTKKSPTTKPIGRISHAMASIDGDDKVVIFGGNRGLTNFNDTWVYDLSEDNWTKIKVSTKPPARYWHDIASFSGTNEIILFGGANHSIDFDDTWILSLNISNNYENGTYISVPNDTNSKSSFKTINWIANVSANTSIKFQLRSAFTESELNLKNFIGPDGNTSTFYNTSETNIWLGHNGDKWIQYKAYLNTTNKNETPVLKNVTIIYNNLPQAVLYSPFNGTFINNNKLTFVWNFTDLDSSNQEVFQVIIDNNSTFKSINYDSGEQNLTNKSWQFPNGTVYTVIPDGIWYWKMRTKDNDGDWGEYSEPWSFTIDTAGPGSTIINPVNNGFYNNLNTISGIAYDPTNGSGVSKVDISIKRTGDNKYWSGSTWISSKTWLLATGTTNWLYDSSTIPWSSGVQYEIRSRAIDNATNIEDQTSGNIFTFDTDNPTSMISAPFNGVFLNNLQTITGTAFDTGGTAVIKVEITIKREDDQYFNGNNWDSGETWLKATGTIEWSYDSKYIPWITDNEYIIQSRAIDNVGNIEMPSSGISFMFDDKSPENLVISINNGMVFANSTTAFLNLNSEDSGSGVNQMAFSNNGITWSTWELFNTTKHYNLTMNDGEKTIYFKVKDKAENIAESIFDEIILDTTSPTGLAIEINAKAKFTNTNIVTLNLKAKDNLAGINNMSLSRDGIEWLAWEPFTNERFFSLPPMDGEKTVYLKVQDNAGNIAEPVFDTIILDTTPPTELMIQINENADFTNTMDVELELFATDSLSGISEMSFSNDGETWTDWEPFKNKRDFTLLSIDGEKTIYFRVKDLACNIEETADTIILDTTPPHSLSILINNGTSETNSAFVNLYLEAIDDLSGVYQMSLSKDGLIWDSWRNFSEFIYYNLESGYGIINIYFRVRDRADNIAEPVAASVILNTSKPIIDSDGDNYPDDIDIFPNNKSEWFDLDSDGIGDNADDDNDNDGYLDDWESILQTNPLNKSSTPIDTDDDGVPDGDEFNTKPWMDQDDDGDGFTDNEEIIAGTNPKDNNEYPMKKEKKKDGRKDFSVYIFLIFITIIIIILISILGVYLRNKNKNRNLK